MLSMLTRYVIFNERHSISDTVQVKSSRFAQTFEILYLSNAQSGRGELLLQGCVINKTSSGRFNREAFVDTFI